MKKFLALLLSTMLLVTALAGCGNNESGETKSTGGAATTETATTEASEAETSAESEVSKDVELLLWNHVNMSKLAEGETLNENLMVDYIKETTGMNPTFEALPAEEAEQKISIIISSGKTPDMIEIEDKAIFSKLAKSGALMDITDYINEHGQNLLEYLPEDSWNSVMIDGRYYGIPKPLNREATWGLALRQDLLEASGLGELKTKDDFKAFFEYVKAEKGMYGLTGWGKDPESVFSFHGLTSGFGLGTVLLEKDGGYEWAYTSEEAREYITWMKELYDEGLLDPDFILHGGAENKEALASQNAAAATLNWWGIKGVNEALKELDPAADLQFVHPMVDENGMFVVRKKGGNVIMRYIVPTVAENPAGVVDYLNALVEPEVGKTISFGFENEHYTMEEGVITPTDKFPEVAPYSLYYVYGEDIKDSLRIKGYIDYYNDLLPYTNAVDYFDTMLSVDEVDEYYNELRDYAVENALKFILGARDIAEFDDYVNEFNAMGGQASIDAINAAK